MQMSSSLQFICWVNMKIQRNGNSLTLCDLGKFYFLSGGDPMDLTFITGQVRRSTGGMVSTTLQLSAQTSASRVQAQIEHKLVKRGRETLAGPRGKKVK